MATIDLGKIKQVWRGTWSSSPNPAYSVDDLVEYTDTGVTSTYIAVSTPGSQVPSSGGSVQSNWNLVAKGVANPIPTQSSSTNGKALVSDGTNALWGDGGAWTKIASGVGPTGGATSVSIDNIFSDSYKFYKVFYSWAQDDWMKGRYINADGSIRTNGSYCWTGQYAADNGDEHGRFGNVNTDYMVFTYWDAADDSPALCEITLWHPYASSRETNNYWTGMNIQGTKIFTEQGSNSDYTTGSRRGLVFFGNGGDNIDNNNFNYLVLGSNIG